MAKDYCIHGQDSIITQIDHNLNLHSPLGKSSLAPVLQIEARVDLSARTADSEK